MLSLHSGATAIVNKCGKVLFTKLPEINSALDSVVWTQAASDDGEKKGKSNQSQPIPQKHELHVAQRRESMQERCSGQLADWGNTQAAATHSSSQRLMRRERQQQFHRPRRLPPPQNHLGGGLRVPATRGTTSATVMRWQTETFDPRQTRGTNTALNNAVPRP